MELILNPTGKCTILYFCNNWIIFLYIYIQIDNIQTAATHLTQKIKNTNNIFNNLLTMIRSMENTRTNTLKTAVLQYEIKIYEDI